MYEQILRLQSFSEAETREIIKSSLKALANLHQRGVIHRDIKPENLLICPNSQSLVKLADFGFATYCKPGEKVSGSCGSPSYVAPDILSQKPYDSKSDLWSLGVIMFLLCFGELPFYSEDAKEQFNLIKTEDLPTELMSDGYASPEACDLVRKLLVKSGEERLSAEEALNHPWFQVDLPKFDKSIFESVEEVATSAVAK